MAAFVDASNFFVASVERIEREEWDGPGLGEWTVRELVAHGNRAHTTVVDYVLNPRDPEPPGSDYFSDRSISLRARQAVVALGEDPLDVVLRNQKDAFDLIETTPPDAPLGNPARAMTLAEYLPSRVAELTIHGLDLLRAIGETKPVPGSALAESLAFVGRASARRDGEAVLLALSGRGSLPPGFSAY